MLTVSVTGIVFVHAVLPHRGVTIRRINYPLRQLPPKKLQEVQVQSSGSAAKWRNEGPLSNQSFCGDQ